MGYQIDFPSFTGQSRRLFYALLFVFLILTEPSMQCGPGRQRINSRRHRKLTPLVFKQHIPNVSENTLGASGLAEGRITRDDPAFKDLVANHNPDIIFKDEERTGSDRIMSERCKDKLNTLAIAVMSRWAGVKLRVTEAWDEDGHHAWDSLHYEGRAVDITPSDRDRTKYGMLARLAVEAGFDWVYYESRSHIHCSVKSDSSIAIKTGGCFPGVGTAYLFDGYTIPMNQLSVGDMVLAMDANGQPVFSKILMFAHVERHRRMAYTLLETSDGRNVSLTPGHLIHASRTEHVRPEQSTPIFAADVKVGDFIYTTDSDTVPQSSLVTKVTAVVYKGAYAPITQHGTIVVDDVVTSCYAMINSHALAHWSLAPVRMYDTMMNYAETALSARDTRCQSCSAENIEGVHWYINLLHDISLMVIDSGSFYHR